MSTAAAVSGAASGAQGQAPILPRLLITRRPVFTTPDVLSEAVAEIAREIAARARRDLIDEDALLALVGSGRIGPPGMDVFRNEPRIDPRWLALPEAALLPHVGSASHEARIGMGLLALSALETHFEGGVPPNCINPAASEARVGVAPPVLRTTTGQP